MPLKFFLAGIMQGSKTEKGLHEQDYRDRLKRALAKHFPDADIYDPLADHRNSLEYDRMTGREVFFHHNRMCRSIDVLVAFVPQASMGTAIEMWEAYQHGAVVITISPMRHNWAIKFLSHALYDDLESFERALEAGEVAAAVQRVRQERTAAES
ncbi:MAG: hypothetical protein D6741_03460 [Planctomycetota bacterium]|nr:MAG: hypothetical protein D6741_03460 [Planctomycetota bacterium]